MRQKKTGFTIIELLIVVIVIGILAAVGVAKYQNFAETSRRKTCLVQLHSIETGLAVWETTNQAFGENAKCAWGLTVRTGRLTDSTITPTVLEVGAIGSSIGDNQPTVGAPAAYTNSSNSGPLGSVIRDDNMWLCPAALSRYYNGEIQNVPDDYMDVSGAGLVAPHGNASPIGLGGRYFLCVAGPGNTGYALKLGNGGFPAGWLTGAATLPTANSMSPCAQAPFKIAICGNFGTFGNGAGVSNVPGTSATNQGGPVGPDGSTLSRHSARW